METGDGGFYVVKFLNNPQHRRILVNELVSSTILSYLQIGAPPTALVEVSAEFLAANPDVHLTLGSRRVAVEPGWHFGSRYPGDPDRIAVYDFLPDALLGSLANVTDFRAVLVFDKWMSNVDGRQSIFYRAQTGGPIHRVAWVTEMIDHGFVFNGPHWEFVDSPVQGMYSRRSVYEGVRGLDDFQPWLDQVVNLPPEVIDRAMRQVPPGWIDGEEEQFDKLLESLWRRRKRVPELVRAMREGRGNPFPDWSGA